MVIELYREYQTALKEAKEIARRDNGYIVKEKEVILSDRTDFDYIDRDMRNVVWSGEISGIIVRDNDTYEDIAYLAYWE